MNAKLHIWVGNPRSPTELSIQMRSITAPLPKLARRPQVVYEKRLLQIADLADGFTQSPDKKREITASARQLGIEAATAMLGLQAPAALMLPQPPGGWAYLGAFQAEQTLGEPGFEDDSDESLYRAVAEGAEPSRVARILEAFPASVHETNAGGQTPLMASAISERPDLARLLLDAGSRVDVTSPAAGYTPLHLALSHPPRDQEKVRVLAEVLITHGAEINAPGSTGVTPLMLAAWFGAEPAAAVLLQHGANPKLVDTKGRTAADIARERGHARLASRIQIHLQQWLDKESP